MIVLSNIFEGFRTVENTGEYTRIHNTVIID